MKTSLFLLLCGLAAGGRAQTPRLVVPVGHSREIHSVSFSADGKYVLTGSGDCTAKLWDLSGHEIQTFIGHKSTTFVESVAISPDGQWVLTGGSDGTAKRWGLDGREIQTFSEHARGVNSVAISPDGKFILTGSDDQLAILRELSTGIAIAFRGHTAGINSVAFSPANPDDPVGGKYILTGSDDATAILWDRKNAIRTFSGHSGAIEAVAFSPDGKTILTGSSDSTVILWDLSGNKIRTFSGDLDKINAVAFSPDGKSILAGGTWSKKAILWDTSGRTIKTFSGHPYIVSTVAFSPACPDDPLGGRYILTGSFKTYLWDMSKGGRHVKTFSGFSQMVALAEFSPDGKMLFVGSDKNLQGRNNNTAKLWDLAGNTVHTISGEGNKTSVKSLGAGIFSPDNNYVLTNLPEDSTTKLWDRTGHEIQTISGTGLAFSPDSKSVLTSIVTNERRSTQLCDLKGRVVRTFDGGGGIFSPDGQYVLTTIKDPINEAVRGGAAKPLTDTAELWDINGRLLKIIEGTGVAFSPDSKQVLTVVGGKDSWKGKMTLWDLNGRLIQTFSGLYNNPSKSCYAISPDSKYLLATLGSFKDTATLSDLNGHAIQTFSGHTGWIYTIAISPDGQQLLTGSEDHTVKLYKLNGELLFTFNGHTAPISSVAFSPDGKMALTGSDDGSTKLWDTQSGKELATLVALDSADWVVSTPSGLFDASPGAMKRMYFVQGLEVIALEQLKGRYWEPGLLSKIMGFSKGALRNVSAFGTLPLYPEIKAAITGDRLHVDLVERSGGMGRLSLSVNGKEKMPDANPGKKTSLDIELKQFALDLLPDGNSIALRSYIAGDGWLKSQDYELPYIPGGASKGKGQGDGSPEPKPAGSGPRPEFYGIVVGTSQYESPDLKLSFPDGDAQAMEQALRAVSTAWLGADHVHIRRLSTDAKTPADLADKVNIAAAFRDYAAQAKSTDILVVFFSGHGKTYTANGVSNFYYLTKDMRSMEELGDAGVRGRFAISDEELGQWLIDNHAQRQVLIFDACNSGTVVQNIPATGARELNSSQIRANDLLKDRTGTFILAGAAADKVSFEASKYDQGLLTRSLLEGMSGLALDDDRVDVAKLFEYACRKVPELAADVNQVQKPVPFFPKGGSFPIGIKDASVQIHLRPGKPVIIRNNFQDDSFGDALGLTNALEQYFLDLTVRPAEATVSYIPVNEYNDEAYSIRGSYSVNGDAVEVHGRLFKGKTKLGDANFTVNGLKGDVPGLAKKIVDDVWGMVK